jgi:hypothetical protein
MLCGRVRVARCERPRHCRVVRGIQPLGRVMRQSVSFTVALSIACVSSSMAWPRGGDASDETGANGASPATITPSSKEPSPVPQGIGPGTPAVPMPTIVPWQPDLPPPPAVPHEKNPDSWPQPDYFSEALNHTNLKADTRFGSATLRSPANAPAHQFIVLPVQIQAFGFTPPFRALVGAYLDHELAARKIAASRQTDITDAYAPFARRLDSQEVDTDRQTVPAIEIASALYRTGWSFNGFHDARVARRKSESKVAPQFRTSG